MIQSSLVNNVEDTEAVFRYLSTRYHKDVKLSVTLEVENDWIDPCNSKFVKLLKLPRTIEHMYYGESVTYISNKHYGTTSLWYFVVACSGYLHQDEIPKNTSIFLPSSVAIESVIKEPTVSNVGKTIII